MGLHYQFTRMVRNSTRGVVVGVFEFENNTENNTGADLRIHIVAAISLV